MEPESLEALVGRVPDGAMLVVPPDYAGVAMAATRALAARGVRGVHLLACPTSGLQAETLIAAGCVATVEAAAITLGEFGAAPVFGAAMREGRIRMLDSTCPAIHAALTAAEKGLPFIPLRGLIGSDVARRRTDWKTIQNPFSAEEDPIILLPALRPDVALFHVAAIDEEGNALIGRRRELVTMAHAARMTLVTAERIERGSFYDREEVAAGVLPSLYVTAAALAPRGAWPLGFGDAYAPAVEEMRRHAAGLVPA